MRRERDLAIDTGQLEVVPGGRRILREASGVVRVFKQVVKRVREQLDGCCGLYDDGVIVLHVDAAPGEIAGAADGKLNLLTLDDNHLVVL